MGLTPAHQRAFNLETIGYEYPTLLQVPSFVPRGPARVRLGGRRSATSRRSFAARRSGCSSCPEPSGGSDVAGALTTAVRDGDEWVINGSKIWTTGAYFSDYGLCLLRTNWDVPAPRVERVHHQDPPARHRAAPHRDDQRIA